MRSLYFLTPIHPEKRLIALLHHGYKASTNNKVGPVSFRYEPQYQGLVAPLVFAKLPPTFVGLRNVTLKPTSGTTTSLNQEVAVDDVNYTLYYY